MNEGVIGHEEADGEFRFGIKGPMEAEMASKNLSEIRLFIFLQQTNYVLHKCQKSTSFQLPRAAGLLDPDVVKS